MRELAPVTQETFYTPEQTALMKAHFAEYLCTGTYKRFIQSIDGINDDCTAPDYLYAIAARAEYPIRLTLEQGWIVDESSDLYGTAYFLEQYNPNTGEAIAAFEHGDIVCTFVIAVLDDDGNKVQHDLYGRVNYFTDEDIELLFRHGQQQIAAGIKHEMK